ncbi:mitochondrial inner membrane protease subunit [Coniochaeta sp. 2T2.1]|nr:mitochondrial inner membrane protease subunit [Coniochaeta sp. 2T2.1]
MALGLLWARVRNPSPFARQFSRYLVGFVTWLPVLIVFNSNVAEVTLVDGPSMHPYFNTRYNESLRRDLCLNWKLYAQDHLQRGMVVTFRTPHDPNKVSVKRIIGLEGDVVHTRRPYPNAFIRVPQGHIWVEGDAQDERLTIDSNTYGPISAKLVTGRITHILLPFEKAGRVKWWEHRDRVGIVRA